VASGRAWDAVVRGWYIGKGSLGKELSHDSVGREAVGNALSLPYIGASDSWGNGEPLWCKWLNYRWLQGWVGWKQWKFVIILLRKIPIFLQILRGQGRGWRQPDWAGEAEATAKGAGLDTGFAGADQFGGALRSWEADAEGKAGVGDEEWGEVTAARGRWTGRGRPGACGRFGGNILR
jgi:hypothetical protein